MRSIKYLIIPFIALGLTLSLTLVIEYNCVGKKMFPTYYGSPFVFMKESLGSSLEYHYSVSGILLNAVVWSTIITLLRFLILRLIKWSSKSEILIVLYNTIIVFLSMLTLFVIVMSYTFTANRFDKNSNYWYWNLDKEATAWGMKCEGEWKSLLY